MAISQRSERLGMILGLVAAGLTVLGLIGCEGEKSASKKSRSPAPAQVDPAAPGGVAGESPTKLEFDSVEVLEKKIEVKAYHLLVKDRGEDFSGYCIAASHDPELPPEALKSFVVKAGPCPATLSIDGSKSKMAYICKPIQIDAKTRHQVILYGKLQTADKYEDIRQVKPEIVLAFCNNPHAS